MRKLLFKFIVLISLLALLSSFSFAVEYYADVELDIRENGELVMSGLTNHPSLEGFTQEFTSKKGSLWTLDISLNESFEDYVFAVHLPDGASLTYVKGKNINIATSDNHVVVKGFASNAPFSIFAQYKLSSVSNLNFSARNVGLGLAGLILFIFVGWLLVKNKAVKSTRLNQEVESRHKLEKHFDDSRLDDLSERQLAIMKLLKKGSLTQKSIEKTLNLPKSSISRNIESLRRRGLIKKEHKGLVNRISLISGRVHT